MVLLLCIRFMMYWILHMLTRDWSSLENEVADEWIERDTKERCCGNVCCCPRRTSVIRSYCCSIYFLIKALGTLGGTTVYLLYHYFNSSVYLQFESLHCIWLQISIQSGMYLHETRSSSCKTIISLGITFDILPSYQV